MLAKIPKLLSYFPPPFDDPLDAIGAQKCVRNAAKRLNLEPEAMMRVASRGWSSSEPGTYQPASAETNGGDRTWNMVPFSVGQGSTAVSVRRYGINQVRSSIEAWEVFDLFSDEKEPPQIFV